MSYCDHEHVAPYVNGQIRKRQVDIAKCQERINKKNISMGYFVDISKWNY